MPRTRPSRSAAVTVSVTGVDSAPGADAVHDPIHRPSPSDSSAAASPVVEYTTAEPFVNARPQSSTIRASTSCAAPAIATKSLPCDVSTGTRRDGVHGAGGFSENTSIVRVVPLPMPSTTDPRVNAGVFAPATRWNTSRAGKPASSAAVGGVTLNHAVVSRP